MKTRLTLLALGLAVFAPNTHAVTNPIVACATTTVYADGVALAAIQGLNQKVEEQKAENAALKARLEKLEQLLEHRLNRGAK